MQYRISSDGRSSSCFFGVPVNRIVYDDVVDRSQFRPDSENIRNKTLSSVGGSYNGVYDDNPDEVTNEEVLIRSGKLDRTEIQNIINSKVDEYSEQNEKAKQQKELDEVAKLNKARQDFLDVKTGFVGIPQGE